MPPSETDNVTVTAPAALPLAAAMAMDEEKLPSTNPPIMQPNNNCPMLNQQHATATSSNDNSDCSNNNNGIVEHKEDGATPQAVDLAVQTDDDVKNGSLAMQQDALHSTNNSMNTPNNSEINNNNDTPLSTSSTSPRRRIIKKRRSDDFVYADTKKQEKPPPNNKHNEQHHNGGANTNLKSPPTHSAANKPKPPRKRPHQCPTTDSILINVPLSVTADLGVALKRTRRKRIKRIQDWVASSGTGSGGANNNNKATVVKKKQKKSESIKKEECAKGAHDSCSDSNDDSEEDDNNNEQDITLDYDDEDATMGKTPKRNHYGSVVDYLEAKYVRGVMIADYDDRELAKQQKLQQQRLNNNDSKEEEEEEVDSEGDNSCYDDEDGFIDDSLMVEDVAGQVMASSTYGLTQIEEEARRRKEERSKKDSMIVERDATEQPQPNNSMEELGITEEKLEDDPHHLDEGMESGFDDGFFVNLGDLEMAEGWSGENVLISPTKKKKKRTKKRVSKATAKEDVSTKKKKKKASSSSLPSSPKKKKKSDETTKQKTGSNKAATSSPKKGKKTPTSSGKSEDKQPKKKEQAVKHPKKVVSPEKERATQLRKLMKRKYNACIKMIKEMSSDQLPLKQRNKKTVKLSVSIPADKNIGDEITFANPNIPGQKLKVQIPAKADMEKRTFVASVPGPKVPFTKKENNLPKEFKEALCDYSTAYDDWCVAEEAHNASLPENKRKDYKITTEKMKKFDEMITEFPKKLATPIDATYLRAAVRRIRSNKARQEKRKSEASETLKRQMVTEKVEVTISVPQKGSEFDLVSFNKQDFQE